MMKKTTKKKSTLVRGAYLAWMEPFVDRYLYENKEAGLHVGGLSDLVRHLFYKELKDKPGYEKVKELYEAEMEMSGLYKLRCDHTALVKKKEKGK